MCLLGPFYCHFHLLWTDKGLPSLAIIVLSYNRPNGSKCSWESVADQKEKTIREYLGKLDQNPILWFSSLLVWGFICNYWMSKCLQVMTGYVRCDLMVLFLRLSARLSANHGNYHIKYSLMWFFAAYQFSDSAREIGWNVEKMGWKYISLYQNPLSCKPNNVSFVLLNRLLIRIVWATSIYFHRGSWLFIWSANNT